MDLDEIERIANAPCAQVTLLDPRDMAVPREEWCPLRESAKGKA